ncbi:MAG: hypothetical protein ABDI07_06595 [Candidatus Kryptonium sp.]
MNSKSSIILISLISFLWLTGCGPTYLPAIWDSAPPMHFPNEIKTKGDVSFISGYYNQSTGFNQNESNKFFKASYGKALGGKWYRFAGSGFAYIGVYNVTQSDNILHRGKKSYLGFGGDIDANVFLPLYLFNLGVGLYSGICTELGDYASVWRKEENWGFAEVLTPLGFIYAFTQFNITKNDKLTFRLGVGLPSGYSLGISYYNLNYGGLWIGFHPTETETGSQFSFSSFGISVNIK